MNKQDALAHFQEDVDIAMQYYENHAVPVETEWLNMNARLWVRLAKR